MQKKFNGFVIYIAGPYRGPTNVDVELNIDTAKNFAIRLWEEGYAVICPHLNSRGFKEEPGCDTYLEGYKFILELCDAVLVVGDYGKSEGTMDEIRHARKNEIPIFYSINTLFRDMEKNDDDEEDL